MLVSGTRPCKQHAVTKSERTDSVKGLLLRLFSKRDVSVGNVLVSTRLSALVIHNSELKGYIGSCVAKEARMSGTLLIKYDLMRFAVFWPSFLKMALASTSKDARMRSIAVS